MDYALVCPHFPQYLPGSISSETSLSSDVSGTREDLWKTVPPKMAQRVLAGMLNESLTILTVRYTQV